MPWIERFGEVELEAIERPNIHRDWTHTKSYDRVEVEEWVNDLQTIQNLCHSQGMRHEDFERMRSSSDPRECALGRTHHIFYNCARQGPGANGDPVKLTWDNGQFLIDNGQHRVDRALALGLRTIPTRFSVRKKDLARAELRVHDFGPLLPLDRGTPSQQESDAARLRASHPPASTTLPPYGSEKTVQVVYGANAAVVE